MAKIAFILLCHKNPDAIIRQAESLTATGDCVSIHFDARAPAAAYARIRDALKDRPGVTFAAQAREMRLGGVEPRARLAQRAGGRGGGVSARHAFLHALGRLRGGEVGRLCPCLPRRAPTPTTSKASISSPPTGSRRA
jgi:hypothetical protein